MKSLVVSTSTSLAIVGLVEDQVPVFSLRKRGDRGHSRHLLGLIECALRQVGWDYGSLDELIVDIGPGGFTGVRVGIATLKGLCLGLDLPLYGTSVLDAIIYTLSPELVVPVVYAGRSMVYTRLPGHEPRAVNIADVEHEIPDGAVVAGPAAALIPPSDSYRVFKGADFITIEGLLQAVDRTGNGDPEAVQPLHVLPPTVRPRPG